jgi:hypothetical protein
MCACTRSTASSRELRVRRPLQAGRARPLAYPERSGRTAEALGQGKARWSGVTGQQRGLDAVLAQTARQPQRGQLRTARLQHA